MGYDIKEIIEVAVEKFNIPEVRIENMLNKMITYVESNPDKIDKLTAEDFYNWAMDNSPEPILTNNENEQLDEEIY